MFPAPCSTSLKVGFASALPTTNRTLLADDAFDGGCARVVEWHIDASWRLIGHAETTYARVGGTTVGAHGCDVLARRCALLVLASDPRTTLTWLLVGAVPSQGLPFRLHVLRRDARSCATDDRPAVIAARQAGSRKRHDLAAQRFDADPRVRALNADAVIGTAG